ncbi:hypothetical protein AVEN_257464-1 [Araneus ventricosus]|uniref:Uncharacterized protein n=1 Tax=Araneus ventricosus TaxID=182803 RepID=A0A4Y2L8H4_ARAVE|nr:hypothetical protein AVEN_257464-1 [Araneus ventricosus]
MMKDRVRAYLPQWHFMPVNEEHVYQSFIKIADAVSSFVTIGLYLCSAIPEVLMARSPIPPKIRRVWGPLHAKPHAVAKRPPVGEAWKFGDGVPAQMASSSSDCGEQSSWPSNGFTTGARYCDLFQQQAIPALQEQECLETTVFMQDAAPPHVARPVCFVLTLEMIE